MTEAGHAAFGARPVTLRNNPLLVAPLLLGSAVGFIGAAAFTILALAWLPPLREFSIGTVLDLAGWVVAALGMLLMGVSSWRHGGKLVRSSIVLRGDGVHFRLAETRGAEPVIRWSELRGIARRKGYQVHYYTFFGGGDRAETISSFDFLRVGAVARRIAAASGIAITDLP